MSARRLVATASAGLCLLVAASAGAQVSIDTQIAARKIEVGSGVQFQITALSTTDSAPENPRLPPVPGLSIQGPNVGSQRNVTFNNGRVTNRTGISATWTIRALKVGTFRIGPASVEMGGQRFQSEAKTLEVVAQGAMPSAPRGPQPFDPFRMFDPFGGGSPFPQGMFGEDPNEPEQLPPVPEELRVDRAPDPMAFVRAVVFPKHPVVGEQVTVRLYAYGGRGGFRAGTTTVPTHPDFLDYTNATDSVAEDFVRVPIGETTFLAKKIGEFCLFPLHAGRLGIGPMTVAFDGPRYRSNPMLTRLTPALVVEVTEPPLDGRPAGYRLGDVGTLELNATVDPRRAVAGDSVGVVAQLKGKGNIPTSLRIPEQRGVEWADPTHVDEVTAERGVVQGFRAFNYLVKLSEPGSIDLGELTLPYWDPERRAYRIARFALGKVEVRPSPKPQAVKGAPSAAPLAGDPLALKPRRSLGSYPEARTPFTDGARFWYLLFGAPVAVALTGVGIDLGGRIRRRRTAERSSPLRLAQEALKAAEAAARSSEIATTAAAVERALFLAIEAGTGLRARAFLKNDLSLALTQAGLDNAVIERALTLLDACESARFTGKAGELPPKELCARAKGAIAELSRKRRRP